MKARKKKKKKRKKKEKKRKEKNLIMNHFLDIMRYKVDERQSQQQQHICAGHAIKRWITASDGNDGNN